MITIDETPRLKKGNTYEFAFKGLSGDTKPTNVYDNMAIANGSTFLEMDTQSLKFYNEEAGTWV